MPEIREIRKASDTLCTCGLLPCEHPICSGCYITVGSGRPICSFADHKEFMNLTTFRRHDLCGFCIKRWQRMEARLKNPVPFAVFKKGVPSDITPEHLKEVFAQIVAEGKDEEDDPK